MTDGTMTTELGRAASPGLAAPNTFLRPVTQAVDPVKVKAQQKEIAENYWGRGSLSQIDAYRMARIAIAYELDPFLGHLEILGGNPYITLAGHLFKAQGTGLVDGMEFQPLSEEELKQFKVRGDEIAVKCLLFVVGKPRPYVGYGYASQSDVNLQGKKSKNHDKDIRYMAENRSLARALRRGFPIGLASAEELSEEERIELAKNITPGFEGTGRSPEGQMMGGEDTAKNDSPTAETTSEPAGDPSGKGIDLMQEIHAMEGEIRGWFPAKTQAMLKNHTPQQILEIMNKELAKQQGGA